jgi:hypothetical protein
MGHVEDNGIAAFTDAPTFQAEEGRLFSAYLPPLWCGAQNRERTIDKNVGIIGPIYIFGNDERSRHVHVLWQRRTIATCSCSLATTNDRDMFMFKGMTTVQRYQ